MIHGQSRVKLHEISQEEQHKQHLQANKILEQMNHFLQVRRGTIPPPEDQLAYTQLISQLCPEITTVYNYRREVLIKIFGALRDSEDIKGSIESAFGYIQREFDLINMQLKYHSKSYTLWSHRQWLVLECEKIDSQLDDIPKFQAVKKDFVLCNKMLQKDERNFHVWNYRNWLISLSDPGDDESFTLKKIEQNFSNYSAYHFRSKFFLRKYNNLISIQDRIKNNDPLAITPIPYALLKSDLELIQSAIYIQPKEHGLYLYHKWLIAAIQPYGLISIQPAIKCESLKLTDTEKTFIFTFNRRVSQISLNVTSEGDELHQGVDFTFSPIQGDYSHFFVFKLKDPKKQMNFQLNSIYDDSLCSDENFNSRFFVGSTAVENASGKFDITIQEKFDKDLSIAYQMLQENIKFIEEICSEEKENRFALLQLGYLLSLLFDLYLLQSKYQDALQVIENQLAIFKQFDDESQELAQTKACQQLWNHKKLILLKIINQDFLLQKLDNVLYDHKSIDALRILSL